MGRDPDFWSQPKEPWAVTPAPVRVPTQWPLVPSFTSVVVEARTFHFVLVNTRTLREKEKKLKGNNIFIDENCFDAPDIFPIRSH